VDLQEQVRFCFGVAFRLREGRQQVQDVGQIRGRESIAVCGCGQMRGGAGTGEGQGTAAYAELKEVEVQLQDLQEQV
jgi:hypothetical protein